VIICGILSDGQCVCVVALRVESTQCSIAWLCYIGNVYSSTESRSATWHNRHSASTVRKPRQIYTHPLIISSHLPLPLPLPPTLSPAGHGYFSRVFITYLPLNQPPARLVVGFRAAAAASAASSSSLPSLPSLPSLSPSSST
jgi:hypothetical protein